MKLNEFEKRGPITNVAIVSKDNLNWIAESNGKYENLGNSRKEMKRQVKLLSNKDIIGNEKVKGTVQEKKFMLQHPGVALKSELKRMHPIENDQRNNQKHFSILTFYISFSYSRVEADQATSPLAGTAPQTVLRPPPTHLKGRPPLHTFHQEPACQEEQP